MEDKHKRVTQAQLDIWLIDPVTQAYLTCLQDLANNIGSRLSSGELLDCANNDYSMNSIHKAIGAKSMAETMSSFESVLTSGEMIEVKKDERS